MAVMALRCNCNYMQPIFMAGLLALKDVSTDAQEIGVAAVVGPSVEDVFADGAGDDDGTDDLHEQLQLDAAAFKHDLEKSLPAVRKNIVARSTETSAQPDRDIADDIADAHIVEDLRSFAVTDICVDEPLEALQDLHENCIPK